MRKKTEGKTEAEVALADFLFSNTNKTIEEAKSISGRFLEQIETKLQNIVFQEFKIDNNELFDYKVKFKKKAKSYISTISNEI